MKNFEIEAKDGKHYWISRSVAVVLYVYAYINGQLCILANKRGPGLPNGTGLWNCPSGYLDFDETLEEAAVREVWEETGIKVNKEKLNLIEIDSDPKRRNQSILFRYMTTLEGIVEKELTESLTSKYSEPNEVDEIAWIPITDLDKYEWVSEKHKETIRHELLR